MEGSTTTRTNRIWGSRAFSGELQGGKKYSDHTHRNANKIEYSFKKVAGFLVDPLHHILTKALRNAMIVL